MTGKEIAQGLASQLSSFLVYLFCIAASIIISFGIVLYENNSLVPLSSFLTSFLFDGNFHEVERERMYRSAKMSPSLLREKIHRYGIKTVVDLRKSGDTREPEEERERFVVRDVGAVYQHVGFYSSELPSREQLRRLLEVFRTAEEPLLVHCESGMERTSFAAALWLLTQNNAPLDEALLQLRLKYGHINLSRNWKRYVKGRWVVEDVLHRYARSNAGQRSGEFEAWLDSQPWYEQMKRMDFRRKNLGERLRLLFHEVHFALPSELTG